MLTWSVCNFGLIPGAGTTSEPTYYSYLDDSVQDYIQQDNTPGDKTFWYWIENVDMDGVSNMNGPAMLTIPEEEEEQDTPTHEKFGLFQNYPNPFNPSTKIKYSIPKVGTRDRVSVQLKVFDILGRNIITLVNEEKPAGEYEVEFNTASLPGDISARGGYASGVYFYQLKVNDFIETKKMVLLR